MMQDALLQNIDQIAVQNDGLEAFICGHDLQANPHPVGTPQHDCWQRGRLSGQQFSGGGDDE